MKKQSKGPRIYVRKARLTDREVVFKFCEKTWSWGDYIQKVWDKWLAMENARLFVATINKKPVGMSHISIDKPHEVWLRAARTDPNYRQLGIATAITKTCLKYAKKKGAKIARLVTDSDNIAAQAVLRKTGFKLVAEFIEAKTENTTRENGENSRWAEKIDVEKLWSYLQTSEIYRETAGLYTVLFQWFSLEKHDLERFISERKAILHRNETNEIDGLMLIDDTTASEWRENSIQTAYIDGSYNAVFSMIQFLKNFCFDSGIKLIYGFAPKTNLMITVLKKHNFKIPSSIDIVYEKKIDGN